MFFGVDDPEYPIQWVYDEDGAAVCTKFRDADEVRRDQRKKRRRHLGTLPLQSWRYNQRKPEPDLKP